MNKKREEEGTKLERQPIGEEGIVVPAFAAHPRAPPHRHNSGARRSVSTPIDLRKSNWEIKHDIYRVVFTPQHQSFKYLSPVRLFSLLVLCWSSF